MEYVFLIGIAIVAFSIPLIILYLGRSWLIALLPVYLITANVFAESFISIAGQLSSLAIPIYAATFLITDTLSEHYGKKDARQAVVLGFFGQLIFLAMMLAVAFSPIFENKANAYAAVFGVLPRIILGSFTAYLISQFWDIFIFHYIKGKTKGTKRTLWIRNNISTISSQLIDSTVFILIAFYGRLDNIGSFILTTWVIKMIVAMLDTPYLYLTYLVIGRRKLNR